MIESKGNEKIYYASTNEKKAETVIIITDIVETRQKPLPEMKRNS